MSVVANETPPMNTKTSPASMAITAAMVTTRGGAMGLPSSGGNSAGVIAARNESKIPGRLRASPEPKLMTTNLPADRVDQVQARGSALEPLPVRLRVGEVLVGRGEEHQHLS